MKFFGKKPNIDWLKYKKAGYLFSTVLTVITVVVIIANGGMKFGIDFAGGTLIQVKFTQPHDMHEIRATVEATGYAGDIQQFGEPVDVLINVHPKGEEAGQAANKVLEALRSKYGPTGFSVERTEVVGPKVGKDLTYKALMAVIYSVVGILIYLAFRFEHRFAVTAIIALLHDTIITIGALVITGREFTLPVLAALLTVIGYALNDRIVVFDRIRENLRVKRSLDIAALTNTSVNETLSRTMITSGLTLMSVVALFVFGGSVLKDFAFTLMVGIVFGTYSSVFVASALLIDWPGITTQKLALSILKK